MMQKHLLLLAFPDPALAATVEGPPASKGWGKLQAGDEGSKTTRIIAFAFRCTLANMGQICLALHAGRPHDSTRWRSPGSKAGSP